MTCRTERVSNLYLPEPESSGYQTEIYHHSGHCRPPSRKYEGHHVNKAKYMCAKNADAVTIPTVTPYKSKRIVNHFTQAYKHIKTSAMHSMAKMTVCQCQQNANNTTPLHSPLLDNSHVTYQSYCWLLLLFGIMTSLMGNFEDMFLIE